MEKYNSITTKCNNGQKDYVGFFDKVFWRTKRLLGEQNSDLKCNCSHGEVIYYNKY